MIIVFSFVVTTVAAPSRLLFWLDGRQTQEDVPSALMGSSELERLFPFDTFICEIFRLIKNLTPQSLYAREI